MLRPTILDHFGLEASLRWLCEGFSARTGIETAFTADAPGRYSGDAETHLFRIAQEALTNVARHSGANRVKMDLRTANFTNTGVLELTIADNGSGIGPGEPAKPAGLGMIGMRARARWLGGVFILEPSNGGTQVSARIPLARASAASTDHDQENPNPVS